MALSELVSAYDATGAAWETGPARIYNRLADAVVAASPVPLAGRTAVDIGAGTGAASRAIEAAGGRAVAADAARGMLIARAGRARGSPAVQADALALPFADRSLGAAVAAFSLNHVGDAAAGLREAARVVAAGGPVLASSYAEDDRHPVKAAVEAALVEVGWQPPRWADRLRRTAVAALATPDRCAAAARAAGLDADVRALRVPFSELGFRDLVEWRLGMAQHAPFWHRLDAALRARVRARAVELLADPPPLVRSILVIVATA